MWVIPRCCLATALSSKKTTLAVLPWTMCELSDDQMVLSNLYEHVVAVHVLQIVEN